MLNTLRFLPAALFFVPLSLFAASTADNALLDHQMKRLHSNEVVSLQERYAGKPLLFINTASHCGYTPQFKGLEALHKKYGGRGLMVAGFPSNSFRQEAGDEAKTADVCYRDYGVTFDMYAPLPVKGADAHPLFQELARQSQAPRWNFFKYLIDRNGNVVASFANTTRPDSAQFIEAVEKLLNER